MASGLRLILVTPERKALDIVCDEIEIPGEEGYLGILPGHTPLITLVKSGELSYRAGRSPGRAAVGAGFAEVSGDVVTVLSDFAELPAEIDAAAAARERAEAEEAMKSVGPETFDGVNARLEAANARLKVASPRP